MLIFVSDLHLADSRDRSSFDDQAFLREVRTCLQTCPADDKTTLVLLGDIFELLKSTKWLDADVRPWHLPSEKLAEVTVSILDGIGLQYPAFFAGLCELNAAGQLDLIYVPGNHDGLLADEAGGLARAKLRAMLPVQGVGDADFEPNFPDAAHGVYSEHGHEFDDFNRRYPKSRFVPGDVVVIELATRLPVETAACLSRAGHSLVQGGNDALRFLQELDNVLPQDGEGLMSWLKFSIERAPDDHREALRDAVLKGLNRCVACAAREARQFGSLSGTTRTLLDTVRLFIKTKSLTVLKTAARLQPDTASEVNRVTASAQRMGRVQARAAQDTFLYVAGHTHFPRHHLIAVGAGRTITYLNTGTWRRVYLQVPQADGSAAFATYNEETMLCVYRRIGDNPPGYEFRRNVRGL